MNFSVDNAPPAATRRRARRRMSAPFCEVVPTSPTMLDPLSSKSLHNASTSQCKLERACQKNTAGKSLPKNYARIPFKVVRDALQLQCNAVLGLIFLSLENDALQLRYKYAIHLSLGSHAVTRKRHDKRHESKTD